MSHQNEILFEIQDGVAFITLNRPDVLNSFHRPMAKAFQETLNACAENTEIRAVNVTGAGRAFCAGQDLAEAVPAQGPAPEIEDIVRESYNPIVTKIRQLEKPVICAVNGVAAGAGANIALACDIVIASEKASFLQAFCHIGLIPDSGGTWFLPRLIGLPRATAQMMLGEKVPAAEALEMGMIYKVVPAEELAEVSSKLARHLAKQPTKGLGLTKRALNASFDNDLLQQLEVEEKLQGEASHSHDYLEGVKAFQEKRKPEFKGS